MSSENGKGHAWKLYPAACFDASPTYNAWVKLTAADVQALRHEKGFEGQGLYFHLNHPIRYVQLVGPVTSIDEIHPRLAVVTIDDGSGATLKVKINRLAPEIASSIDCPSNTEVDNVNVIASIGKYAVTVDGEELEVATVIKVKGTISVFRELRQLELKRIVLVRTTNEEAAFWSQMAAFKTSTLAKPWVLDNDTMLKQQAAKRDERIKEQKRQQVYREKWRIYHDKTRARDEKQEQKRRKEEVMMNAGALPGTDLVTLPWNIGS